MNKGSLSNKIPPPPPPQSISAPDEDDEVDKKLNRHFCIQYEKMGICQRGESCFCIHRNFTFPHVVILHHIYPNPDFFYVTLGEKKAPIDEEFRMSLFDAFYYDLYAECVQFGQVLDIVVSQNVNHLLHGTAWILFQDSDSCIAAYKALNNRFYAGRRIHATLWDTHKLSTIICEPSKGNCTSNGYCPFVHPIDPSPRVRQMCFNRTAACLPTEDLKIHEKKLSMSPDFIQAQGIKEKM